MKHKKRNAIEERHTRFLCHQLNKLRYTKDEMKVTSAEYVYGYTDALNTCISVLMKNTPRHERRSN